MDKHWRILFCDNTNQNCPISEFIETCKPSEQNKIFHFLNLLEITGPTLPRPYADLLEDGIHELRIKLSGDQIRILYFFCFEEYIVLYQVFQKTTDRVPIHYIEDAKQYRDRFIRRLNKKQLEKSLYANV